MWQSGWEEAPGGSLLSPPVPPSLTVVWLLNTCVARQREPWVIMSMPPFLAFGFLEQIALEVVDVLCPQGSSLNTFPRTTRSLERFYGKKAWKPNTCRKYCMFPFPSWKLFINTGKQETSTCSGHDGVFLVLSYPASPKRMRPEVSFPPYI